MIWSVVGLPVRREFNLKLKESRVFPRPFRHGGICPPIWGGGQSVNGGDS